MLVNSKKQYRKNFPLVKYYNDTLIVTLEENNIYGFEIDNKVFTSDHIEAISYILRTNKFVNKDFWNINILNKNKTCNTSSALYWLTGGDDFWLNPNYDVKWYKYMDLYVDNFNEIIKECYEMNTFKDIKLFLEKNSNLDVFYEFALKNKIL